MTTKYGQIEGKWALSFDGRRYAMFEGIPYAKPPVGELRFEVNIRWELLLVNF